MKLLSYGERQQQEQKLKNKCAKCYDDGADKHYDKE